MVGGTPSCIVLGAGGFLGTNLCRRLVSLGARVRAFGRSSSFPDALKGAEWFQGDFSDPGALAAAMEGFEVVFHLVHDATPFSANLDMARDVQLSVIASLALFDISRRLKIRRIVFVSSGGTIYGRAQEVPTPETAPTDPITAYGVNKLLVEKYLALYEHLYGLDFRVLRVANPFGPFQVAAKSQGFVAALISRALAGEDIEIWGDGSVVRDYIFVDDVVEAMLAAVTDQSSFRTFNIGTGTGRSLRDVIATMEMHLGRKLAIAWKPGRAIDVPTSVLSITRAQEVLHWSPKVSFEDGVRRTIDWWRSRRS
jgi:UDP-glucose 4-epimerase